MGSEVQPWLLVHDVVVLDQAAQAELSSCQRSTADNPQAGLSHTALVATDLDNPVDRDDKEVLTVCPSKRCTCKVIRAAKYYFEGARAACLSATCRFGWEARYHMRATELIMLPYVPPYKCMATEIRNALT